MAQVSPPINWQPIENALFDWFVEQSGLDAEHVIWGESDTPQPIYPFGAMTFITGPNQVTGFDEITYWTDPAAPPETQIIEHAGGSRAVTLNLQIYDNRHTPYGSSENAMSRMCRVQTSLAFARVTQPFSDLNFSVVQQGNVIDISQVANDAWIEAVSLDVNLLIASNAQFRDTYIERGLLNADPPFDLNDFPIGG